MKKNTLLIVLLALSLTSWSQNNWVSIRIHDVRTHHTTTSDPMYDITDKAWQLLPAVGYYRLIGDTWGIGCEFGYAVSKTDVDDIISFPASDNISIEHAGTRVKQYYLCPSVFDMFAWEKYRLMASLAFPVTYNADIILEQRRDETSRSNQSIYGRNDVVNSFPDLLSLGVFCNLGVQRKIFKGLYCGPQIGIGLYHNIANGDRVQTTTVSDQDEIKTVTILTIHQQSAENKFDIRPAFSISYFF